MTSQRRLSENQTEPEPLVMINKIIIFFELFESLYDFLFTDLPKTELTVTPDSPVFTGETVNLTCVIESYSNWRYEWYKDSVMLQTSVNRDTLTIRGVNESDQGQYWCRGQIRLVSSQSSSVYLSVTGELNIIEQLNSLYVYDHTSDQETFNLRCYVQSSDKLSCLSSSKCLNEVINICLGGESSFGPVNHHHNKHI